MSQDGINYYDFFGPGPEADAAKAIGMDHREFGALMFISIVDNPNNPKCLGPVVIHVDGVIECEGGCSGVRNAYHGQGSTAACDVVGGSTSHRCARCR